MRSATFAGRPIRFSVIKSNTTGIRKITMIKVIKPFKKYVKFLNLRKESLSITNAVEALIIMMMGDSISTAKENAIPKAAKLNFGAANRAITAANTGPSAAIMSQVAAKGTQKKKIRL